MDLSVKRFIYLNSSVLRWSILAVVFASVSLSCAFADSVVRGGQPANVDEPVKTVPPAAQNAETTPPTPEPPEREGLIAYLGLDGNIYTIDRDGEQQNAVTADANLDMQEDAPIRLYQSPTWSPDGQHLAIFQYSGGAGEQVTANLVIADIGASEREVAFSSQEYFPFYMSWSPDNRFVTLLSSSRGSTSLSLHLVEAASGDNRIIHTGQPFYWDWSPDAQQILVHTGGNASQNRNAELGLLNTLGERGLNAFDLKPSSFQSPAWSPDGEGMVMAVQGAEGAEALVLTGMDGGMLRELDQVDGPVAFAWSPSGDRLAYTVQGSGVDQSATRTLKLILPFSDQPAESVLAGPLLAWFWSPDGEKIAYFMLVNSMGKGGNRLAQAQIRSQMGLFVLDIERGESRQLALFRPTESFLEVIPYFDQYQRSSTIWSPDSTRLVLSALDPDGAEGIYVIAVDGSFEPQRIAEGVIGFWSR